MNNKSSTSRLNVDAFLDELYVLFSPRVYLLSDVKPLVDESYHQRIDELCDKVRSGAGGGGGSAGSVGENYSLPAALNTFSPSSESKLTSANSTSNNNSSGGLASSSVSDTAGGVKAEARSNTPLRGGGGTGNNAETHSAAATGVSSSARNGSSSPSMPLEAAGGMPSGGLGGGSGHGVTSVAVSVQSGRRNDETEGMLSMR